MKNFGTVPFAIYARHAFIAKKLIRSLVNEKIISDKTYSKLLNSVGTITNEYIKLKNKSKKSIKNKNNFYNYFFHLRPGTYDININRYKNRILEYKIENLDKLFSKNKNYFRLSKKEYHKLNNFLKKKSFRIY